LPTGSPGICQKPSMVMWSRCTALTSQGRWPVKQDQLQRRIEFRAQQGDLGVGQVALPVFGKVSIRRVGMGSWRRLADRPGEDRRRRGQHLIGQDRRLDPDHRGANVGAADGAGLELAPAREEVLADPVAVYWRNSASPLARGEWCRGREGFVVGHPARPTISLRGAGRAAWLRLDFTKIGNELPRLAFGVQRHWRFHPVTWLPGLGIPRICGIWPPPAPPASNWKFKQSWNDEL
jgi:hypothetical protein